MISVSMQLVTAMGGSVNCALTSLCLTYGRPLIIFESGGAYIQGDNEPMKTFLLLTSILVTILVSPSLVGAIEPVPPWRDSRSIRKPKTEKAGTKGSENMGAWLATFYRDYISRVDGDRCPSFPTCSSYSAQAFRKHGFIMGWMMTVDRLFHEGSEEKAVSPLVYVRGRMKIYDPIENNDFWWYKPHQDRHE